ncbi:MAG: hypothetical protein M3Q69_00990, partial [Acidobacteriota bacterium]|nr:hypothetical protein [Acidobacteriota bacterium]
SRSRVLTLAAVLLSLATVAANAAPRHRAVRSSGPQCAFSLASTLPDPVSDGGLNRARVAVTGSPSATCTSWSAFSNASWITIETDAASAYLTIAPNGSADVRTGSVRIAGLDLQVTQLGHVATPEPNLLLNPSFNFDLRNWGWQDRFPNGTGDATWSSLDANNSIASGSMRLRDDINSGPAYQQLQCVNVNAPGMYEYGAAVRSASRDNAKPVLALVQYDTPDCLGNYRPYSPQTITVTAANTWQRAKYTQFVYDTAKSVSVVVAGWARNVPGPQEVWIDDVFLRPLAP